MAWGCGPFRGKRRVGFFAFPLRCTPRYKNGKPHTSPPKYYTRYMDDLVLLHEDKDFLRECLARMKDLAHNGLHLEFNEKTQIFPVSQGVDYLGWRFYLTQTGKVVQRLRTSNKRRLKRRIRKLQDQYAAGEIEVDEAFRILEGYRGHLEQGDAHGLGEQLFGNLVLKRTSGNTRDTRALPRQDPV